MEGEGNRGLERGWDRGGRQGVQDRGQGRWGMEATGARDGRHRGQGRIARGQGGKPTCRQQHCLRSLPARTSAKIFPAMSGTRLLQRGLCCLLRSWGVNPDPCPAPGRGTGPGITWVGDTGRGGDARQPDPAVVVGGHAGSCPPPGWQRGTMG